MCVFKARELDEAIREMHRKIEEAPIEKTKLEKESPDVIKKNEEYMMKHYGRKR